MSNAKLQSVGGSGSSGGRSGDTTVGGSAVQQQFQRSMQGSPLQQVVDNLRQRAVDTIKASPEWRYIMQTPVLDAAVTGVKAMNPEGIPAPPSNGGLLDYLTWFAKSQPAVLKQEMVGGKAALNYLAQQAPNYVLPGRKRPIPQSFTQVAGVSPAAGIAADVATMLAGSVIPGGGGAFSVGHMAAKAVPAVKDATVILKEYNDLSKARNFAFFVRHELNDVKGLVRLPANEFNAFAKMITRMGPYPSSIKRALVTLGAQPKTAERVARGISKGLPKGIKLGPILQALSAYDARGAISLGLQKSPSALLEYRLLADQSGKPLTLYRIESAAGKGPISKNIRGASTEGKYFTTDASYVRSFTYEPGSDRVIEAQLSVKPDQVLDARSGAKNKPVTLRRLAGALSNEADYAGLSPAQQDFLLNSIKEVQGGQRDAQELLRDIKVLLPNRFDTILRESNISVVLQHPDDGLHPTGATEVILSNPGAMRGINVYTPAEFKQAFSDQANYDVHASPAVRMARKRQRVHGGLP